MVSIISLVLWGLALAAGTSRAQSIAEINGNRFLSPLNGKAVSNVTGVVLAKGPNGIWLRSDVPDDDPLTSEGIYVFGSSVRGSVAVGDLVALDGSVTEYRPTATFVPLTEITAPANVRVLSSGNPAPTPLVIGVDTPPPPTEQYSVLDGGDVFALPNGAAAVSGANPVLDPAAYGLDFWESLSGELVTVRGPVALNRPNNFGDVWVAGGWPVTGRNARGGLTMTDRDANPEALIVGSPLDGTRNAAGVKVGDRLADITGVVTYAFGFYRILPLTALVVAQPAPYDPAPASLVGTGNCRGVTVGVFNVENLCPSSAHLPAVAAQLVGALRGPDVVFLQEVQDDSCAADDGVTTGNATLATLAAEVARLGGPAYDFVEVSPVNNADGGAPGGNIRVAYLYRPDVVALVEPNPGAAVDATAVRPGATSLTFNPGRIDPANAAWSGSRKPLVAAWRPVRGGRVFFTINVHFSSKGGGSSLHGDPRPPNNGAIAARMAQVNVTSAFIASILAEDPNARIIAAGDFNEFTFAPPIRAFVAASGMLDLDEVADVPEVERYSYVFDMNAQQLDHIFVSPSLRGKSELEHLHVNTWQNTAEMVSDHDPSVARFNLCACG